jgi:septum formation protein
LIERIEGSYDNVVGLPLRALLKLIDKVMAPEEDDDGGGLFVDSREEEEGYHVE